MSSHSVAAARPAEILLAEDNEDDVLITRRAFRQAKLAVNLHHVENGEECLAFLRKQGRYAQAPTPDLLLLDLNMPVMGGREVMSAIHADESLSRQPVVILTTSRAERDLIDMYELRCSSYIAKPVDFAQFQALIDSICDYWFTVVILPPR